MTAPSLFVTIVLDGVGIGEQPDSAEYGDAGSHTLRHVCEVGHPDLPHLTRLGLGNIDRLPGVPPVPDPGASYGRMQEASPGKDSTSGHWELGGLWLDRPFPTYPGGFPPAVVDAFLHLTGTEGILCNGTASGTRVIDEFGLEHLETGWPIVYTSADSVFQIAAHTGRIPLNDQYRICRIVREQVCTGEHAVGRVIARPFTGRPGAFERLSAGRKDFALRPSSPPVQEMLQRHGIRTISVGKVAELFDGVGFHESYKTTSNADGLARTLSLMRASAAGPQLTFIWVNLVDFDQEYGHRNDPLGFARALEEVDQRIPELVSALPPGGRLLLTADHGNDPVTPSTDHSREYVPILLYDGGLGRDLGTRSTFSDHAATVAAYFRAPYSGHGTPC
jgi:phosphopentomutase